MSTAAAVAELASGTHACCVFTDAAHKASVVGAFLSAGIARGERAAYYWHGDEAAVAASFGSQRIVDSLVAAGQLVVGRAEEAYFLGGAFDGVARAAEFAAFADVTVADGFTGLRVFADNGWMPAALPDPNTWLEYELRVARLVPQHRLIGLCGFDATEPERLSPEALDAVHEVDLTARPRPAALHVRGTADGELRLVGKVDVFSMPAVRPVLAAAVTGADAAPLSLAELQFVDGAAADELYSLLAATQSPVRGVLEHLQRVWQMLGHDPAVVLGRE